MKKLKKIVAVAIAATMITSVGQASLTAFAAEVNSPVSAEAKSSVAADDAAYNGTCGENLTYAFDQATGTLTISGTGDMTDYYYYSAPSPWKTFKDLIVNVIIEDGVESIGEDAFRECSAIKSVDIASSVKIIKQNAFIDCASLETIVIPSSVESIGYCAFMNCSSLKSLDIPSSVKTIGSAAFSGCTQVESVNLSDGIERIEGSAFENCNSMYTVEIPDSVMFIGSLAFSRGWGPGMVLRCSIGGPAYTYATNENNGVKFEWNGKYFKNSGKCGDNVNYEFDAETQTLVISGTGEMYDYESYYWGTESDVPFFSYAKSIKKIVIEDGVTGLGLWTAFCAENVEEIHFPASVTKIPYSSLPDSSKKNYMIYADEGTYAYNYAIENWYGINGKIQGKCGDEAHYTFDEATGLLTIGGTGEIDYYDTYQFSPWKLSGWNDLINDVVLEEGITSLGSNETFANCPNIKSFNISSTVTDLYAITDHWYSQEPVCFESINVSEENPDFASIEGVLFNKEKTTLISYPINKPGENYSVPDTVKTIGEFAFSYNKNLVSIDIPDSVTSIENYAFEESAALKDVALPAGITSIESYLFYNCPALENVTIPYGVESIGNGAFGYCTSLKNVEIPDSVTSIDSYVFMSCTSLESIVLPNGVTEINPHLFDGCTSLKSVPITDSIKTISNYAFSDCTSLEYVIIPKTLKTLGDSVFVRCTSLSDAIILNSSVKFYYDSVFPRTTTIYGHAGSTADSYAYSNGNEFITIPYVKGYSLSLSGSIGLNYCLKIEQDVVEKNPSIKFCYSDGTVISESGMDDAVYNDKYGYYQFTCPVSASKMGNAIKVYFVINGFEICISDDYSVQKYAEQIINGASSNEEYAKAVELVKAMLNYGAYSEIALTDVTSSNINSSLTDEEKTLAELPDLSKYKYAVSGTSDKVKYSGSLISLKTETVIRHYFTVADGVNAEELTFTVNGNAVTPVKDGRYYRIDIANVNAKNLDVNYQVNVDGLTLDYSVLSYVYSALNSSSISNSVKDSVKALYHFCIETKNYAA